jgi:hypothetical protein
MSSTGGQSTPMLSAQFITICSASTLAEEWSIFSPLQRPIACKKASLHDVDSFTGAPISIYYKLREIERTGMQMFKIIPVISKYLLKDVPSWREIRFHSDEYTSLHIA